MPNVVDAIREKMAKMIEALEKELQADVIGIFGPIRGGVEQHVRAAIEMLQQSVTTSTSWSRA
jgi:hypothetical protein